MKEYIIYIVDDWTWWWNKVKWWAKPMLIIGPALFTVIWFLVGCISTFLKACIKQ